MATTLFVWCWWGVLDDLDGTGNVYAVMYTYLYDANAGALWISQPSAREDEEARSWSHVVEQILRCWKR